MTAGALGLLLVLPLAMLLSPRPAHAVAAIFPPWFDSSVAQQRVVAAGGVFLRGSARSWIILSRSDSPDFARRLYAAGAVLVLDGLSDFGCGAPAEAY